MAKCNQLTPLPFKGLLTTLKEMIDGGLLKPTLYQLFDY